MRWEYFSKRRRISLKAFVKDTKTLKEALILFKKGGIDLPLDNSLELLFKQANDLSIVEEKKIKKPVSKRIRTPGKKSKAANNAKRKENSA